jgi:tetratricopeptide (TPR) repeat protein
MPLKKIPFILLAFLCFCFPALAQTETASSVFMKAEHYRKINNLSAAVQHYDMAIKLDPTNYQYYYQRGQCCILQKDYNCAIKSFEETIRLKRNYVEAYTRLSWLYEKKSSYLTSVKSLDNAFRHQTDTKKRIEYKMKIIQTLHAVGQFGKSGTHIKDVKAIVTPRSPEYLDVLYYEAKFYNYIKNYETAKQSMLTALRNLQTVESQKIARFYYELGYAYYHLGDHRSARAAFNYANHGEFRALIAKMTPQYNYAMANAYYSSYFFSEAEQLLKLSLSLDKNYTKSRQMLKIVNGKINNFPAINLRSPLAQSEPNPVVKAKRLLDLAEYQLGARKYKDALLSTQTALELQPRLYKAAILQGVLYFKLKNYDESKRILRSLANNRSMDSDSRAAANFALGLVSKSTGDRRMAIASFKAANYGNFRYASDNELNKL